MSYEIVNNGQIMDKKPEIRLLRSPKDNALAPRRLFGTEKILFFALFRLVEIEFLLQVKEFKYLGDLFTSEGGTKQEIDRWIGAASATKQSMYWSVVVVFFNLCS